jgi:hypothetical protein
MRTIFICSAIILLLYTAHGRAQEDTLQTVQVTLKDGSELIGHVVTESAENVTFKTLSGVEIELERVKIKAIEPVQGEWRGEEFQLRDPNATRLFFAPSARALKKGTGYFSTYQIFFPMMAVGLTDFVTLSGGMSLLPGAEEQLLYFAPKARLVHQDKLDLSAGILYMTVVDENFGISYGIATYSGSQMAVTGGLGWGFVDGDFARDPFVLLGLESRLSKRTKFISENWFLPGDNGHVFSFGLRFFGKKLAADFALLRFSEMGDGFPFVPWIGFAVNF